MFVAYTSSKYIQIAPTYLLLQDGYTYYYYIILCIFARVRVCVCIIIRQSSLFYVYYCLWRSARFDVQLIIILSKLLIRDRRFGFFNRVNCVFTGYRLNGTLDDDKGDTLQWYDHYDHTKRLLYTLYYYYYYYYLQVTSCTLYRSVRLIQTSGSGRCRRPVIELVSLRYRPVDYGRCTCIILLLLAPKSIYLYIYIHIHI